MPWAFKRHSRCATAALALTALAGAPVAAEPPEPQPLVLDAEADLSAPLPVPEGAVGLSLGQAIAEGLTGNLSIRAQAITPRSRALSAQAARGVFDPALRLGLNGDREAYPCTSAQECPGGEPLIITFDTRASVGVRQMTPLGGSLGLDVSASTPLLSTAANFQNPGLTTWAFVSVSQPLLRGAGLAINRLDIERALMEESLSWETLRAQVEQLVVDIYAAYWSLAAQRRAVELRRQSLDFARRQAEMTRERVGLGFAAPVEIFAVDQGVATRQADLEGALNMQRSAEITLRALLGWPVVGPDAVAAVVPVDAPPDAVVELDPEAIQRMAIESDPSLERLRRQVELQQVVVRQARNARLPSADLTGSMGVSRSAASELEPEPVWSAGVVVALPLGNHRARANHEGSRLALSQAELAVAEREQQVQILVDAAIREVETARMRIDLGSRSRELADRKLDAERERLDRGESTLKNVLDYLEDRDQARLTELQARIDLAGALIRLEALTGALLSNFDVALGDVGQAPEAAPLVEVSP